jgi:hypothetical protein
MLLMGNYPLKADEVMGEDQDFLKALDNVKNPFEDGLPKPVPIEVQPPPPPVAPPPPVIIKPKPVPVVITLPKLDLQGVVVGEGVYEAIINDTEVPLLGTIEGARVISVTKQGVELLFKGKKFYLKAE